MKKINQSFIIEFAGLPGSGKTTIANIFANTFKSNYEVTEPIKNKRSLFVKYYFAICNFMRMPCRNTKIVLIILRSKQRSLKDFRSVLGNWFYKNELLIRTASKRGYHFFCEGIVHAFYLILYSADNKNILYSNHDIFINRNIKINGIILINMKNDILINRLLSRNRGRLDTDLINSHTYEEMLDIINYAQDIYKQIKLYINNYTEVIEINDLQIENYDSNFLVKEIISNIN